MREIKYNYKNFTPEQYDFSKDTGLKLGDCINDVFVYNLEGDKVSLLSQIGSKPLVLETGSMTCPMYAQSSHGMQDIIRNYPQFDYVLLYVREAHPGERQPQHQTSEQKIEAALKSIKIYKEINRNVLVDDVEGSAHSLFGLMPNSIYVIDKSGLILFKSTWNNVKALESVLQSIAIYGRVEHDEFKAVAPFSFRGIRTLFIGGFIALWDFLKGLPRLILNHIRVGNM